MNAKSQLSQFDPLIKVYDLLIRFAIQTETTPKTETASESVSVAEPLAEGLPLGEAEGQLAATATSETGQVV